MRSSGEEVRIRSLANQIINKYNERHQVLLTAHALYHEFDYLEDDLRNIWNTYYSSGEIHKTDLDILTALIEIPYKFWPKDIFLEASLAISNKIHQPVIGLAETTLLNKGSRFLLDHIGDRTSQTGEDGIIRRIFEIAEMRNSWCVEFGAWDGKHLSNTNSLIAGNGWYGVLIEGDEDRFTDLTETYKGNDKTHLFNMMVGFNPEKDSIDFILGQTKIPKDLDLMVIDIDGNDWHVWNSMHAYKPRVVMIEFNPTISNSVLYIQERDEKQQRGCSLRALIELAKIKGYELICASSLNGLFIVSEEYGKFGIKDNSIDAMYTPVMDGHIFHGYDSSIHVIGMPTSMWDWHGHGSDWTDGMPERLYNH